MTAVIKIRNLEKTYDMGATQVRALGGIALDIEVGEYVAIMGPSGSGKSTLLNILGCLDVPTAGSYELSDALVSQMDDDDLARIRNQEIGFVFQTFNLLPRSNALGNVELPLIYSGLPVAERRARAERALAAVGLDDRSHHRPNELSGGQRQRVAIARATITEPRVLLADEPTGNLDHKSGGDVIAILEGLVDAGITLIMVTHDPAMGGRARRQLKMMDGRLASDETGGPDDTA